MGSAGCSGQPRVGLAVGALVERVTKAVTSLISSAAQVSTLSANGR